MKIRKFAIYFALMFILVPVLTACGPQKIDAALTTYNITLSQDTARAGQITFHVHNDATDLTHEFVIFKTDLDAANLPLNSDGTVNEDAPQVNHIDEVELEPGKSQDLTVNLQAGHYAIICNRDSTEMHYQHGMHVNFNVK